MMISLKVISLLLDYPSEDLWEHRNEIIDALQEADELPVTQVAKLMAFIRELTQQDLLDAQANYSEILIEVERDRYCYLNMYMVNRVIVVRQWLICLISINKQGSP